MRLGNLFSKAKRVVDQRGGTEALKQDAEELSTIARGKGSATDKAKRAAEALKEPGGGERGRPDAGERGRPDTPGGGRPDTSGGGRPDPPGPDRPDQPVG